MLRVTDLGDGVNQGILPVRLEYNMEVDSGSSGWVAQSLPVDWNGMPGVLDLHVVPRYDSRREVGEGYRSEEEEHREPEVWHGYWVQQDSRNVRIRRLKILRGSRTLRMAGMQCFYGASHRQNRGWSEAQVSLKFRDATR